MEIRIRPIQKSDNAPLANIIRTCFLDYDTPTEGTVFEDPTTDDLFQLFQTPDSFCFVAEDRGVPVGCCGIYPTNELPDKTLELVKFYLQKKYRGHGIGYQLLQQCENKAQELGFTTMYLETKPEFKDSIRLYERNKYQMIDQPLGDSGHTGCDVWMTKSLSKTN